MCTVTEEVVLESVVAVGVSVDAVVVAVGAVAAAGAAGDVGVVDAVVGDGVFL